MKAPCWRGANEIRCDTIPDPTIENPRGAIIKVTGCAIRGSDRRFLPQAERGRS